MTLQNPQNTAFSYDRTRISVVDISADYYCKKKSKAVTVEQSVQNKLYKIGLLHQFQETSK